jgi:hypothetical protein
MKTISNICLKFAHALAIILVTSCVVKCEPVKSEASSHTDAPVTENDQSIMLALLLDTSSSMDGLIDQAKSQLWKIVNELAEAKCINGDRLNIKIALYEYGNDGLPSSEGYIRLVSPLTNDLDVISEKLFALRTNGGNEYCGHVIKKSLNQLEWSASTNDLKMIFIAGNEPFTQGEISYEVACNLAKDKDVVVNTIFCGEFKEGINTSWKRGADITGGTYMSISQNSKTVYIPTPYDQKIDALNDKLNDTYIYYGSTGESKKELQKIQDDNANQYSRSNKVERAVSKSSHAYKNESWDLVDASAKDKNVVTQVTEKELPQEMQGMSIEQRKQYVEQKATERKMVQEEIRVLNEKRKQFIASNTTASDTNMLDAAMLKAVKEKAMVKRLTFTK